MLADLGENMSFDLSSADTGASSHGTEPAHADEAALVAAAAAMAAAAQGHDMFKQEDVTNNFATPDLSSYFLAAAAASVQAQHLREQADDYDTPHTNGASDQVDEDKALVLDQCRKYTDDRSPCPIDAGKRCIGGFESFSEAIANPKNAEAHFNKQPLSNASVELGKTRCYWALLSADHSNSSGPTGDQLDFVYLDPVLQQHLAEQAEPLIGSNFFDYVHPEECDRVRDDMRNVVESRTLFGSVTRCRYSRVPRIRELLGAVDPPRDPEAHRYVEDDNFVAIDIVINWIGDGMVLCFFHAIIDKGVEDNEEDHKSDWTNWCGTPGPTFTLRQCDLMWKKIKVSQRETVPDSGPVHVFQVIEAGGQGRVLLSWPPPRLFPRGTEDKLVSQSDTTEFQDGSYFADDFARLAQGVSIAPGSSSLSDANTSCTRRFRAKHTLTTEGKVRSIESVLIPYGGVILACFQTTFQQQLPVPDPRLVAQARLTLQAQAERRKPEDVELPANKRPRLDDSVTDATSGSEDVGSVSSGTAATQLDHSPQAQVRDNAAAKIDNVSQAQIPAMPYKSSADSADCPNGSLNSNTGFGNGLLARNGAANEHNAPVSLLGGASDLAGNVNTLATVAAAAAAQNKSCTGCGKINSPEWRRGPTGHKTLCNACGLRYARSLSRRKKKKGKDGAIEFIEPTGDPTVVPKSRGGGGGSLPGVHRKNSKKRQQDGEVRAGSSVSSSTTTSPTPSGKANGQSSPSAKPMTNGTHSHNGTPAANGVSRKPNGQTVVGNGAADEASAAAVSRALTAMAQASSDPLTLPVSAAISKAIAASMEANGNVGDAVKGLLTTQSLSDSTTDVGSAYDHASGELAAAAPLNPDVSAAALQNMGASVSEALYNQLVQSGLPLPKTENQDDATPLLSADILQAAAQAAVAHGMQQEDAQPE